MATTRRTHSDGHGSSSTSKDAGPLRSLGTVDLETTSAKAPAAPGTQATLRLQVKRATGQTSSFPGEIGPYCAEKASEYKLTFSWATGNGKLLH